jgi:hypothetical protein
MYFHIFWYQIGRLGGRRIGDMVKMHLVKMDLRLGFGQVEEVAAEFGELDRLMGQFPFAILLGLNGCAKSSA